MTDPAAALPGGRDAAGLRPDLNPVELLWANVIDVEQTNLCPRGVNVSPGRDYQLCYKL
jgi:hypothetical protein